MDGHDTGHCFQQLKAIENKRRGAGWQIARVSYQLSAVDIPGTNKISVLNTGSITLLMSFLQGAQACSCVKTWLYVKPASYCTHTLTPESVCTRPTLSLNTSGLRYMKSRYVSVRTLSCGEKTERKQCNGVKSASSPLVLSLACKRMYYTSDPNRLRGGGNVATNLWDTHHLDRPQYFSSGGQGSTR